MENKIFEKNINGSTIRKQRSKIVVVRNGKQIINPSEELVLSDGWKIYTEPILTDKQLLEIERRNKINEILHHDSSEEVNSFYINDMQIWLDKATRAGLMLRLNAEAAMDKTSTVLWYEGYQFPLDINDAYKMLYAIEVYASACYDNTQKHLSEVEKLTDIESIQNYDYRTGYPDKLVF